MTLMSQRASGAIKEFRFFANGESNDNPVFFDAVPEPTGMVLFGTIGLVVLRRWRR
jgi:hypothetical protein